MSTATFFLSAGRCGTQWVAKTLGEAYADVARTAHEPIFDDYVPRRLLGLQDPERLDAPEPVLAHIRAIERHLEDKSYIECGWQCFAAIPYLAERFDGRFRVVHLTRHPVLSASSMMTHRYYSEQRTEDQLNEKALLTPFDAGIRFPEYKDRWETLDDFEKCLYFWAEVHAFALRLETDLGVPWLRLKSEELFGGDGLTRLLSFLDLPRREPVFDALKRRVDRWHRKTTATWDIDCIDRHPQVERVAKALGYDPRDSDQGKVEERYLQSGVQVQPAAFNIALPGADLQSPFDVAVVMTTVLRPALKRAVQSVFDQDFSGRIQILIGVDTVVGDRQLLKSVLDPCPSNCVVTLLDPKYSTSIRHGGLHAAKDGGALRTVLSYLANSRYVTYLDDDNWWHADHLSSLLSAIGDADWAFSHRWYVDPLTSAQLCIDQWESVGPDAGAFREQFGGFVDPSSLMINKLRCESVLRWWTTPLEGDEKGMSADRNVFAALKKDYTVAATNKATCNYTLDPKDGMHPYRLRWIREAMHDRAARAKTPGPGR